MANQFYKHPSASRNFCVDFTAQLATTAGTPEVLTGTPTTSQSFTGYTAPDANLTIGTASVNSSAVVPPNGEATVPASQGVTFQCSAGTDGYQYKVRVTCGTNAGNTLAIDAVVNVGGTY